MSRKILDTFVRVSTATRDKLRSHCWKHNLEQGRFADAAILALIAQPPAAVSLIAGNGSKPAKRKAAK